MRILAAHLGDRGKATNVALRGDTRPRMSFVAHEPGSGDASGYPTAFRA